MTFDHAYMGNSEAKANLSVLVRDTSFKAWSHRGTDM